MKIMFSTTAKLYDVRDPNFYWGHSTPIIVLDVSILQQHNNLKCDEAFSNYLHDGSDAEIELSKFISGGFLVFQVLSGTEGSFGASTEYETSRQLSDAEVDVLKEFTLGQWLDGIGSGFQQDYADETGYWPEVDSDGKIIVSVSA